MFFYINFLNYFVEGGQLEQELAYTKEILGEGYGSTVETVMQTADDVINVDTLLRHVEAVKAATRTVVHVDGM